MNAVLPNRIKVSMLIMNIIKYILLNAIWMPTFIFFMLMKQEYGLSLRSILIGCFCLIVFMIAMIQGAKIKPLILLCFILPLVVVCIEQLMIALGIQKETIFFSKVFI
ncbi:hypothetical protein AMD00_03225 [Viridibacillus arvi]|uniref:Uncharacterized protein n=1 Tax=Viridibacillus arvi TaxID=263475 RepID=A0A0M0LKI9_9BACL|nr:hypothetical protein AMD00_03225 [Viridibacillus arvi]